MNGDYGAVRLWEHAGCEEVADSLSSPWENCYYMESDWENGVKLGVKVLSLSQHSITPFISVVTIFITHVSIIIWFNTT